MSRTTDLSLYVDLPFCIQRCAFCDFNVRGYREAEASVYLDALLREIPLLARRIEEISGRLPPLDSVYLGGGTPSRYPVEALARILQTIAAHWSVGPLPEITLEAHPATLTRGELIPLRALGINRLSLGVQSLDAGDLRAMGRRYTPEEVARLIDAARRAGWDNIGIDLIYGLPGQSVAAWQKVVDRAVALLPDHLSVYGLSIEKGTLWGRQASEGRLHLPTESEEVEMFRLAQSSLAAAGYEQYEISNYARPGRKCRHNLRYWEGRDYTGIGLSAHSSAGGIRWANTDRLDDYLDSLKEGKLPIEQCNPFDAEDRLREEILFGLRLIEGVRWRRAEEERFGAELRGLLAAGLLERNDGRMRLTDRGILLADEVAVALS